MSGHRNDENRSKPGVGFEFVAIVSGIREYGFFAMEGEMAGLCHSSRIKNPLKLENIKLGMRVRVSVCAIREDGRLSLDLIEIIEGGNFQEFESDVALDAAVLANQTLQSERVKRALEQGTRRINRVGVQYARNSNPSRAGFVAEADHQATFNVDAAFQDSHLRAVRLASTKKTSPDIVVADMASKEAIKKVSSKVYKSAEETARSQRGYQGQERLVPQDQISEVKAFAEKRAAAEQIKGGHRKAVADEFRDVADNATDSVKHGSVSSSPRTRDASLKIAEKAKAGEVMGADIVGDVGRRARQGARQGGKAGAITGAAIGAASSTYKAVKDVKSGRKTIAQGAKDVAMATAADATDGAIKGGASGAAQAAARVMAERTSSQIGKRLLGGAAPAAAAITAVEVAKHAVDFARGKKSAAEFRAAAKASAVNGGTSYLGAEIGLIIGGPVGAIVGGVAVPMIAEKAKDAGLGARLDRLFSTNTATGHDGGTIEHLKQLETLINGIKRTNAILFSDRLIISGSYQSAAGLVIALGESVYLVEFRAWKGTISYQPVIEKRTYIKRGWIFNSTVEEEYETGEFDRKWLLQTKEDQYGIEHQKVHRNPLVSLFHFEKRLRERLLKQDEKWAKARFKRLAIFPEDGVVFSEEVSEGDRISTLDKFIFSLNRDKSKVTPGWMLDGLSCVPTWDTLQDESGTIYQGIIETETFSVRLENGSIDIPFDAIIKVDVDRGSGAFSRYDGARVLLRDGEIIKGFVERQEIVLNRKGWRKAFLLRDLKMVCPAYRLLEDIG